MQPATHTVAHHRVVASPKRSIVLVSLLEHELLFFTLSTGVLFETLITVLED